MKLRWSWWPDIGGWRLSTRIVMMSMLLLLLVQAAGMLVVRSSIERNARAQVAKDLEVAERVWGSLVEQNAERLTKGAEVQATDYGFREAVSSHDMKTMGTALENLSERMEAGTAAFLDPQLNPVAIYEGQLKMEATLFSQIAAPLREPKGKGGQLALLNGHPYLFVMAPVRSPLLVGWILMGFAADDKLAKSLYAQSGVWLAAVVSSPGQSATVPITTLSAQKLADLQRSGLSASEFRSEGDTLIIRSMHPPTIGGNVNTLLLRSLNQAVAPFNDLQLFLLLITGGGLLLFGVGSLWAARRIATPLRSLVEGADRLGSGNYEQRMLYTERRDEIGDLANAFDRMRKSISISRNEIQQLAYWDRLTRLPNRVRFRTAIQEVIAQRDPSSYNTQSLAVITLNLDRFKHVNDILGYAVGDRLLVAVAERLLVRMGDQVLVARLGGDEFAVLLPMANADSALVVAQAIGTSFESPLTYDEHTVDLSASLGVACWPQHATDVDSLLGRAEVAMYAAKRKATVTQLYDPALDSSSKQTLSLLSELRHAVEHNELRLFLQPKISLATGQVVAAEALVRWQHPQRGLVPPDSFIPFCEQTGFVRQLTLWMFDEAARLWAQLQVPGLPLRIAINLSTRDLLDLEFPARLESLLSKHDVAPEGFCLEITESAIMDDPLRAEGTLKRLSDRGFKLSIDDFGTGYS
ncbi:MAG: EAL domain-containing protein, partial [Burkholderiales bacterium]|nr:EAL domain-containing protein [Burkholderiales bacterium]